MLNRAMEVSEVTCTNDNRTNGLLSPFWHVTPRNLAMSSPLPIYLLLCYPQLLTPAPQKI